MMTSECGLQLIDGKWVRATTFYGLSTDTKPTVDSGAGNGSAFIEMDTSKVYFFDAENSEWLEWGAETNATSNAASSLSVTRPSLTLGNTLSPDVEGDVPAAADTTEDGEDE